VLRSNRIASRLGLRWLSLLIGVALALANLAAVGAADAPELSVEVDQATLTSQLSATLAGQTLAETPLGPLEVDTLAVELRDGALTVSGTARAGWLAVPVDLTASAVARSGRVLVRVDQAHVGGLPLNDGIRQGIERTLQDELSRGLDRTGVSVRSVTIGDGRLVVVGALGPSREDEVGPAASPSATPTPTARPSQTPAPTLAPAGPTSVPPPTLAPLPSLAPLPTLIPLPTVAPLPTFPLPGPVDSPTPTPEDTATPSPTSPPTDTPAATPTSLPIGL